MAARNDGTTGQFPNDECFDIVKTKKTYNIPCRKNVREAYTVEVPKTKAFTVNKQVPYIAYEPQIKQVPYQYFDYQTVVRNVPTCSFYPVTSMCAPINMRCQRKVRPRSAKKKKCPRTVYIKKMNCQPRQFCQSIPRMGYRTVQENVPVWKYRTESAVNYKTETVPEVRYRTKAVTKMVQKTVPVYSIAPKSQPAPGEERVVKTVRAPEGISILPAATTYPGAQSSLIPVNVPHARQNNMMYNSQYSLPEQAVDLNYKRSTNPGLSGHYTGMNPNYGPYMGSVGTDWKPIDEITVRNMNQKRTFPVEKVTDQPQVNYKTENIPKVGYVSQANPVPMHSIARMPSVSLGEENFIQRNRAPEERTHTAAVSHVSAVDPSLIPIHSSEFRQAVGRSSVHMARSSVPRQESTVITNYGDQHMEHGQSFPVEKVTEQPQVNYKTENIPKVGYGSQANTVPMHSIAQMPSVSMGEENFIQRNRASEERTNTNVVSHASAVDASLIPINSSEFKQAVGRSSVHMARSSVPRQKSTVTTNHGDQHMEHGQKIGSIDTNKGHIKHDRKFDFQKVTVDSNNVEVPRGEKYKNVYGTKNQKGYNNDYTRVTQSTNDKQTSASPNTRVEVPMLLH